MKKLLILLTLPILFLSCKKNDVESGTFDGPEVSIQHGKGKSWLKLDVNGNPQQLGLTINDAALNSMPTMGHDSKVILKLSPSAPGVTPFSHIQIDWNPHGHEPIYGKPHFDFHFYMVSEGEVLAATDVVKLEASPPPAYLPANFVPGPSIPQMGKHFLEASSPELNNGPFTETFIYGTYDGKVTFYEPMITLDFMKSNPNFERAIPQPAKFMKAGNYPTKMYIKKHDGVTDVVLTGFVQRQAS
jgi:hypothetical protein